MARLCGGLFGAWRRGTGFQRVLDAASPLDRLDGSFRYSDWRMGNMGRLQRWGAHGLGYGSLCGSNFVWHHDGDQMEVCE